MDFLRVAFLVVTISSALVLCHSQDTREGEDVNLECRFPPHLATQQATFYWLRTNKRGHDNVAISSSALDPNYRVDLRPEQGRYDLLISNASFDRDNGQFECRLKVVGSGKDLHSQSFTVTVLTPPSPPQVTPGLSPTASEGKPFQLSCSSAGGSPDPTIRWYREGHHEPLEAVRTPTEQGVTSILTLNPSKEDDGAVFRCTVWNRAMAPNTKLEAIVNLNVNYFPRVSVGPENPLRVERDGTATLECNVDAKPRVANVRWTRNNRFIAIAFSHTLHRVALQDAGKYTCTADNGLGKAGEAEIILDVQYPPQVTIEGGPSQREAEEGENLMIKCNVSANPAPVTVEWTREGRPDFRQTGQILKLHRINADSAGTYTCRALNILTVGGKSAQKVGNNSVTLLVRHKPGRAQITPDRPVATEGSGVTLTCSSSPPGWPVPQYRWWRDQEDSPQSTVLATGPKYNIPSAHLASEGKYHCQAINDMGHSEIATVVLTVHQPPRFLAKLQPHVTKRIGDTEFSAMCGAQGKPKPTIKWFKDGQEVALEMYEISTDESEGRNSVYTVQSTLRFTGRNRPSGNELMPADRGVYSCVFENEVKRAETTMHLRIEHEPIIVNTPHKVAYDLRETAEVMCRVQAYPRPEFFWYFGTNSQSQLTSGADGHYEINTTVNQSGGDIFTSVLQISNIQGSDYGDYSCKVHNAIGKVTTTIRLQPKGPPEKPEALVATAVGHNYVTLKYTPGFDGGVRDTKYFVSYRRTSEAGDEDCVAMRRTGAPDSWHEVDCQRSNPCNVTNLDQHQRYIFKMKAYNPKGHSNYSDEISELTKVDRIPAPQRVAYDPETHALTLNIAATCLRLVGVIEVSTSHVHEPDWNSLEDPLMLIPSGAQPTRHEATITSLHHVARSSGRSLDDSHNMIEDDNVLPVVKEDAVRVRVKLCLENNPSNCGDYVEAEIGAAYIKEAATLTTPTLVAIIVSCVVFVLFIGLMFVYCRCRKVPAKKGSGKDYEMETTTIVQQPPPPYYPASGMENKALDMDPSKAAVYAGQNGYSYHGANQNGGESSKGYSQGVNMGYMENSYSNSNNGGSQDSLWQMKMAAANNNANAGNNPEHHHHHIANHYGGYDPLTHGGYGAVDDYAPYPHLVTSASPDYSRNASRQDYTPDKLRRREHHMESPYHDVSGLPDPYHLMMENEENHPKKPHQEVSLSLDESLESGYSTPNSRSRRIIREIIV
ncbi:hemicentin-1 isoform X2 [Macrosteles quadrilineatus]|uniref:hemicentin-1 isoform X2 n=1 Tax=Macrosteles quadrilineatus TaxID=74068 RepID=UPI0023E28034|nr:hemicentin-1 isoform X2 [Macrosteles quadrilineatus]